MGQLRDESSFSDLDDQLEEKTSTGLEKPGEGGDLGKEDNEVCFEQLKHENVCEDVTVEIRTVGLELGRKAELEVSFAGPPPEVVIKTKGVDEDVWESLCGRKMQGRKKHRAEIFKG